MKFVFGKPIDEPFDRESEINELSNMIKRGQPTAVIGVRRIGKTSIILKTLKDIEIPNVYISTEDFIEGKSFDLKSFLSYYSSLLITSVVNYVDPKRKIPKIVKYKGKEIFDRLRELLGYLKLSFNINFAEIEVFLKDEGSKASIPEIIDFPQRLAEEFKVNTVIVIDEFQYLRLAMQNFPGLFHLIRSKWQFHNNISYVISGSSVGLLEGILSNKKEPFYQFFYPIYVKQFDEETSINFLKEGFKEERKEFEIDGIYSAVKELDGIPAWLNYFGLKSLQCEKVTIDCAKNKISEMYRDPIVREIVESEYNKLGKNAKTILKFLAREGGRGSLKGIELSKSSIEDGLRRLMNDGYIKRDERGMYSIIDPVISKVVSTMI